THLRIWALDQPATVGSPPPRGFAFKTLTGWQDYKITPYGGIFSCLSSHSDFQLSHFSSRFSSHQLPPRARRILSAKLSIKSSPIDSSTAVAQTTTLPRAPGSTIPRKRTGVRTGAGTWLAFNKRCLTSPVWA